MTSSTKRFKELDARVENHGSIFILQPLTLTAKSWIDAHVADEVQWFGGGLVVEHRYIEDIVFAMQEDGLTVK